METVFSHKLIKIIKLYYVIWQLNLAYDKWSIEIELEVLTHDIYNVAVVGLNPTQGN